MNERPNGERRDPLDPRARRLDRIRDQSGTDAVDGRVRARRAGESTPTSWSPALDLLDGRAERRLDLVAPATTPPTTRRTITTPSAISASSTISAPSARGTRCRWSTTRAGGDGRDDSADDHGDDDRRVMPEHPVSPTMSAATPTSEPRGQAEVAKPARRANTADISRSCSASSSTTKRSSRVAAAGPPATFPPSFCEGRSDTRGNLDQVPRLALCVDAGFRSGSPGPVRSPATPALQPAPPAGEQGVDARRRRRSARRAAGSAAGWRMNARVCGPPSPPWNEISSSNAQPSSSVGVVEAADHDVGDVREAVGAQQVPRRARREVRERVLALDAAVVEVARAVAPSASGAVLVGADEQPADVRMLA